MAALSTNNQAEIIFQSINSASRNLYEFLNVDSLILKAWVNGINLPELQLNLMHPKPKPWFMLARKSFCTHTQIPPPQHTHSSDAGGVGVSII